MRPSRRFTLGVATIVAALSLNPVASASPINFGGTCTVDPQTFTVSGDCTAQMLMAAGAAMLAVSSTGAGSTLNPDSAEPGHPIGSLAAGSLGTPVTVTPTTTKASTPPTSTTQPTTSAPSTTTAVPSTSTTVPTTPTTSSTSSTTSTTSTTTTAQVPSGKFGYTIYCMGSTMYALSSWVSTNTYGTLSGTVNGAPLNVQVGAPRGDTDVPSAPTATFSMKWTPSDGSAPITETVAVKGCPA